MEERAVLTGAALSALFSLIVGLFSLFYDTTSWYDTVDTLTVLLPLVAVVRLNGYHFSGMMHLLLIVANLLCIELARSSAKINWAIPSEASQFSALLFLHYSFKGLGTFCKLLTSIKVLSEADNKVNNRRYLGWTISLLACLPLTQHKLFYLTASAINEWNWKSSLTETVFWFGLAVSGSAACQDGERLILLGFLQPLVAFSLTKDLGYEYKTH